MTIVFINQIAKIKVYKDSVDLHYKVKERLVWKGWFKYKKEEVIVCSLNITNVMYEIDSFTDDKRYYDTVNKVVKYKPHIDLYLSNGSCESYFFKNVESLERRLDIIRKQNPHIIIS